MYKITKNGKTIVGNNEDWISPNSQFWYEPATQNTYGVMYMGLLNDFAQGAINEAGLVFDGFANPYLAVNDTEGKAKVYIGDAIKKIMQDMQTAEEVKRYLATINLNSLSSSQLVFVDKTGTYLIVEGDALILGEEKEKAFSNFYYSQTPNVDQVEIASFQRGMDFINRSKGKPSMGYCGEVMQEFSKSEPFGTQYSTIYDLNALKIRVFLYHDYSAYVDIDLREELAQGAHKTMMASLFAKASKGHKHYTTYNNMEEPHLVLERLVTDTKATEPELVAMDFNTTVNVIGYEWLREMHNPTAAIKVFTYGISVLPNDADLYDSLGEAYLENHDWELAIKSYAKSLELDPKNENAVEKIQLAQKNWVAFKEKPFKQLTQLIDQYANEILEKNHVNSISLAVYRDGKYYQNYYGSIEKGAHNKPNDSTLFEVASISKVFLGSLVAKAVMEGKLGLDDDIRRYLKGNYTNLEYQDTPITIKNLVTHTVGFDKPKQMETVFNDTKNGDYQDRAFTYTIDAFLEELKTVRLKHKPGTEYQYNEQGPELAAYILEQVYKRPYKSLLQHFLDELGMTNTYLQEFDAHQAHLAKGYDADGKVAPWLKNPLLGGGYGIITTLPDLSKFMKFQLESTSPIVKEATKTLFKDDKGHMMGYFWQDMGIAKKEGFYYSKTGDSHGVQSGLLLCPDSNYGQIVIINNQSEKAKDDWGTLFGKIETDLIMYPQINLYNLTKPYFIKNKNIGLEKFNTHKNDVDAYYNTNLIWTLNTIGYDLINGNRIDEAIAMFRFAIEQAPENANLFDSLGEAYYIAEDYKKSLDSYKKSLALNPESENAKKYIVKIESLLER
jgi:CubicO group peptidase (beta-lactamase class C family)